MSIEDAGTSNGGIEIIRPNALEAPPPPAPPSAPDGSPKV